MLSRPLFFTAFLLQAAGVPAVERWVDVSVGAGPRALEQVWLQVLSGRSAPRTGHVLQL